MKHLYKKIIETLTDNNANQQFMDAGLKPVKYVDEYEGQYFQPEQFEGFILPAVLVEWDINYMNKNRGIATVTLHILYEQPEHANSRNPHIDRALKRFDFADLIYRMIADLESENTGKLVLKSESGLKDPALTKVIVQNYECVYTGKTNTKQYGEFTPDDVHIESQIKLMDDALDI